MLVLDRINKEHTMTTELYYQIKSSILNQENTKEVNEMKDFLNDLPYRLRIRTTMYLYQIQYRSIDSLSDE